MSRSLYYYWVFIWGGLGVSGLLLFSVMRLSARAWQVFDEVPNALPMGVPSAWYWLGLTLWVIFMLYSEGYKGFQKAFAPRVAARILWLAQTPKLGLMLVTPLYAMGFIYARTKRLVFSYIILLMIVGFVLLAGYLPQAWRIMLDWGVVAGLLWGTLATLWCVFRTMLDGQSQVDPELPEHLYQVYMDNA